MEITILAETDDYVIYATGEILLKKRSVDAASLPPIDEPTKEHVKLKPYTGFADEEKNLDIKTVVETLSRLIHEKWKKKKSVKHAVPQETGLLFFF